MPLKPSYVVNSDGARQARPDDLQLQPLLQQSLRRHPYAGSRPFNSSLRPHRFARPRLGSANDARPDLRHSIQVQALSTNVTSSWAITTDNALGSACCELGKAYGNSTCTPTSLPSLSPQPSPVPSAAPSPAPSALPTGAPTGAPTIPPTVLPTSDGGRSSGGDGKSDQVGITTPFGYLGVAGAALVACGLLGWLMVKWWRWADQRHRATFEPNGGPLPADKPAGKNADGGAAGALNRARHGRKASKDGAEGVMMMEGIMPVIPSMPKEEQLP